MKKVTSMLMAAVLMLGLAMPVAAAEEYPVLSGGVTEIQKYGNIILDIPSEKLLEAGYEYGDMLAVTVNETDHEMPLCTNYSDVDTGSLVLRDADGALIAAINMGDFATTNSLATKVTADDGTFEWKFDEGKSIKDIKVSIAMAEKGGYHDQYLIHQLVRTDDRNDYSSDVVFANFRNIASGSLGKNAVFRSSSPVNNEIGRADYADNLAKASGIKAVMNLANSNDDIEGYFAEGGSEYYKSLYEAGKVKALNLGVDFTADDFRAGLADGLRFFAANDGPYLVHCTEGKDRAGFVSALIACFMGASFDEVVEDYMITYENYYHLEKGSEQYEAVKNSNIVSILESITGSEKGADLTKTDLSAAAEAYMKSIGLDSDTIEALRANLAKDYEIETTSNAAAELPANAVATPDGPEPEETNISQLILEAETDRAFIGEPIRLNLRGYDSNSNEVKINSESVVYSSESGRMWVVDDGTFSGGMLYADAPGAMIVTAQYGGHTASTTVEFEVASGENTYTVVAKDCLWNVAYKLYGDGTRWTEIYELNKENIKNPGMIYVGQVLTVKAA